VSIHELAELVKFAVGFEGEIALDTSMPDGNPQKLMDISRILSTGWAPSISLKDGIARTYEGFLEQLANGELRDSK
jgi:GDP-L-fucose synthase